MAITVKKATDKNGKNAGSSVVNIEREALLIARPLLCLMCTYNKTYLTISLRVVPSLIRIMLTPRCIWLIGFPVKS